MVTKRLLLFIGAYCLPIICLAAEFTASVNQNQGAVGEQLVLQLKLSGASPKSSPDISELLKDFTLVGQQQSSSTSIINGRISTNVSWHYGLIPQREGTYSIPAIRIQSSEGPLRSQPLTIEVEKGASRVGRDIAKSTTVLAKVSKNSPYKNESIIYTVQLVSKEDLVNVQFQNISIKDAVVTMGSTPKVYEKIQNGVSLKIAEVNYIITPLKDGPLTLPGVVVQGEKIGQDQEDTLLGSRRDPFHMLQHLQSMQGFGIAQVTPFSLTSNSVTLEVKKPDQNLASWLPAASLKISETMPETKELKVGEPFTRTFTIVAEGMTASQLPNLKEHQGQSDRLKVYEDKPAAEETIKNGKLISWREESYTLIPQQAGILILAEISIPWWNVKEQKIEYTKIPERTLKIMPALSKKGNFSKEGKPLSEPSISEMPSNKVVHNETVYPKKIMLYSVVSIIFFVVASLIFLALKAKKGAGVKEKISKIALNEASDIKQVRRARLNYDDLERAQSPADLQRFLQTYAVENLNVPKNSSLETIFTAAKEYSPTLSSKDVYYIVKSLHDALYAEQEIDLKEVKKRCKTLLIAVDKKPAPEKKKPKTLPDLNPR